jgi:hypothetical protein
MSTPPKYPSTPHWPWSEKVHRDDTISTCPENFVGVPVVVTEKIDGGNTCLYNGEVYARSVASPCREGWMGMVRKHHGWKTNQVEWRDCAYYGEDIFGVHSIEYEPVSEAETFRLFASREVPDGGCWSQDFWHSWSSVETTAALMEVPLVPVLFRGVFYSMEDITAFFQEELLKPSSLGGEREGFVMRLEGGFADFRSSVCKYVRPNHVQTDQHWRRNWKTCKLIGDE